MSSDDLSGLRGLDDKQRELLAEKLGITTCYELIQADRRDITGAFGRRNSRPSLEEVAEWQDEARRKRALVVQAADWEQMGVFVVAFEQRVRAGTTERRIVAEQAEVAPESSPREWDGWASEEVFPWMAARAEEGPHAATPATGGELSAAASAGAGARPRPVATIGFEALRVTDAGGDVELMVASQPITPQRSEWFQPARLVVSVSGGRRGAETSIVLRLAQPGFGSHEIEGRFDEHGRAVMELTTVRPGRYEPTIAAWAQDGSALPNVVTLPSVDVREAGLVPTSPP